jgi:hypothetical protein
MQPYAREFSFKRHGRIGDRHRGMAGRKIEIHSRSDQQYSQQDSKD